MRDNFERCLAKTLAHEGGWADHPSDPGGATMKGVTLATFRAFKKREVTKEELRNISDADLKAIYRSGYWNPVRGDDLPPGIDLVTFDAGVNSGPGQGIKWTQRALGVPADGGMGPITLNAAKAAASDSVPVIRRACANRLGMLRGLRTWSDFGRGWSRRVAEIEAHAVSMAMAASNIPARPVLVQEAQEAERAASRDRAGAVGSGGAAVGGSTLANLPTWGVAALIVGGLLMAVLLLGAARHQKARSAAMQKAALEAKR